MVRSVFGRDRKDSATASIHRFSYGIGCGLAGGDWFKYETMILAFAKRNPGTRTAIVAQSSNNHENRSGAQRYEATEPAAAANQILKALTVNCIALEKSIAAKEAEIARLATCSGGRTHISETPKECDYDEKMILMSLLACEPATVSEIYSPPRVTEELRRKPWTWRSLVPGFALDLTVNDPDDNKPWDFSMSGKRSKAMQLIRESRPYVVIGSPCCTAFSAWQALNALKTKDP